MNVFEHTDYKTIIRSQIDANSGIRGYQTQLAEAAKCQKSYFSQMLRAGKVHLNSEQMMRLTLFWNFNQVEADYVLELLHLAKTTFQPLRKRILARLHELKVSAENLSQRYSDAVSQLPEANAAIYYSSWVWSALHMIVGLPDCQTVESMSARLSLPSDLVRSSLMGLQSMGLVYQEGQRWKIKPGHMHLPRESPLTSANHMNWRQRAIVDSQRPNNDGLHYTSIQSHSFADMERIKDALLKTIDKTRGIIRDSPDEDVTCLCLDCFRIY